MEGKHYKGMTLVEEAELERLRQRQIKEYNPTLRSLGQIQEQIEKLFDDPELSDEGKCKILSHLQKRFSVNLAHYKNSTNGVGQAPEAKSLQIEVKSQIDPIQNVDSEGENEGEEEDVDEKPLGPLIPTLEDANIPSHFANKFVRFQEFLKDHKNDISSNDKKEIVLDGEAIAYSSFPDLVRSLYVRNQDMNLIGTQQFHKKLYELNARSDMFSNRETLNALTHLDKKSNKHPHSQTGFGGCPPGKRPRFLHVFR